MLNIYYHLDVSKLKAIIWPVVRVEQQGQHIYQSVSM